MMQSHDPPRGPARAWFLLLLAALALLAWSLWTALALPAPPSLRAPEPGEGELLQPALELVRGRASALPALGWGLLALAALLLRLAERRRAWREHRPPRPSPLPVGGPPERFELPAGPARPLEPGFFERWAPLLPGLEVFAPVELDELGSRALAALLAGFRARGVELREGPPRGEWPALVVLPPGEQDAARPWLDQRSVVLVAAGMPSDELPPLSEAGLDQALAAALGLPLPPGARPSRPEQLGPALQLLAAVAALASPCGLEVMDAARRELVPELPFLALGELGAWGIECEAGEWRVRPERAADILGPLSAEQRLRLLRWWLGRLDGARAPARSRARAALEQERALARLFLALLETPSYLPLPGEELAPWLARAEASLGDEALARRWRERLELLRHLLPRRTPLAEPLLRWRLGRLGLLPPVPWPPPPPSALAPARRLGLLALLALLAAGLYEFQAWFPRLSLRAAPELAWWFPGETARLGGELERRLAPGQELRLCASTDAGADCLHFRVGPFERLSLRLDQRAVPAFDEADGPLGRVQRAPVPFREGRPPPPDGLRYAVVVLPPDSSMDGLARDLLRSAAADYVLRAEPGSLPAPGGGALQLLDWHGAGDFPWPEGDEPVRVAGGYWLRPLQPAAELPPAPEPAPGARPLRLRVRLPGSGPVRVALDGQEKTELAEDGRVEFFFPSVQPGRHLLRVEVGSCRAADAGCMERGGCPQGCRSRRLSFELPPGEGEWSLATSLLPPSLGSIRVQVEGTGGRPVQLSLDGLGGPEPRALGGGRWRFEGVVPGPHTLWVEAGDCPSSARNCAARGDCPPGCASRVEQVRLPAGARELRLELDLGLSAPAPSAPVAKTARSPAGGPPPSSCRAPEGAGEEQARKAESCSGGDGAACRALGEALAASRPELARACLEAGCDGGDAGSCLALYRLLRSPDPASAGARLERACALGSLEACREQARFYASGARADPVRARQGLEAACSGGDRGACLELAPLLVQGRGGPAQPGRAHALYEQACEEDEARACAEVAFDYLHGRGTERDPALARTYYRMACNGGLARACAELGELYAELGSPARDDAEAARFYQQACEAGVAKGCNGLAWLYREGRGVEQDYGRARELHERACEAGSARACFDLAGLCEQGLGGERAPERARELYQRACEGGYARACARLR